MQSSTLDSKCRQLERQVNQYKKQLEQKGIENQGLYEILDKITEEK